MKLTAPQTLRVIEAILTLQVFTQQKISDNTRVSLGQVNATVTFLQNKGFVEKTRKGYVLSDEIGLLKALSLFSEDNEDLSYLPNGESRKKIEIALKGNSKDIENLFRKETNKKIRVGLIGFGAVGKNHYNTIIRINELELVAVCDIKEYDLPNHIRYYEKYYELLGSEILDAVIIATPSSTHEEIVSLALNHNIKVLCESPCTDSLKSLSRIIDEPNLFIGYTEVFNPGMQKLIEIIDERIIFIDTFRQGPYPSEYREKSALFNLGLHDIMNLSLFMKNMNPVSAISTSFKDSSNNDAYRILLSSDNSIVSMSVDWASAIKERRYVIGLENKTIHADLVRQEIKIYYGNKRNKSYTYEEQIKGVSAGEMKVLMIDKKEPFILEYGSFIRFIEGEKSALTEAVNKKKAYKEAYRIMEKLLKMSKK